VPPSPNVQDQLVGVLLEASMNWTVRGAVPDVTVEVKEATGGDTAAATVI
jgi:hypothetical protein